MQKDRDYIRAYPLSAKPDTWALNAPYLEIIQDKQALWAQHGYHWKFGQEIEFIPHAFTGPGSHSDRVLRDLDYFRHDITPALNPVNKETMRVIRNLRKNYNKKELNRFLRKSLTETIAYIRNMPDIDIYETQTGRSRQSMIAELESYKPQLNDADEETRRLAQTNIFCAFLYTRTAAEGGIRDLAQPRFGNVFMSNGWWDNEGVFEYRTETLDNPLDVINNVHRAQENIFKAAEQFAIMPFFDNSGSHLNYSLWKQNDDGTDRNIMDHPDNDDLDILKAITSGIFSLFIEAPHLIHDNDTLNHSCDVSMTTAWSRGNTIRQCLNRHEFRRAQKSSHVHIARDIALIMGGAAYGLFGMDDPEGNNRDKSIDLTTCEYYATAYPKTAPTYLSAGLCRAMLTDERTLHISDHYLTEMHSNLMDEIGKKGAGYFRHIDETTGEILDLSSPRGWQKMFASIKVSADGQLQTDHLHPELQDLLEPYKNGEILRGFYNAADTAIEADRSHTFAQLQTYQNTPGFRFLLGDQNASTFSAFYESYLQSSHKENVRSLSAYFKLIATELATHDRQEKVAQAADTNHRPRHIDWNAQKDEAEAFAAAAVRDRITLPYLHNIILNYRQKGTRYLEERCHRMNAQPPHTSFQYAVKNSKRALKSAFTKSARHSRSPREKLDQRIKKLSLDMYGEMEHNALSVGNAQNIALGHLMLTIEEYAREYADFRNDPRHEDLRSWFEDALFCMYFSAFYNDITEQAVTLDHFNTRHQDAKDELLETIKTFSQFLAENRDDITPDIAAYLEQIATQSAITTMDKITATITPYLSGEDTPAPRASAHTDTPYPATVIEKKRTASEKRPRSPYICAYIERDLFKRPL